MIQSICIDPSGKYLAAGSLDKSIKIWNLKDK